MRGLTGVVILASLASSVNSQVLATGNYFSAGNINSVWRWQASGRLSKGRCPMSTKITDCYTSLLGATGNLQETTQADYLASLNQVAAASAPTGIASGKTLAVAAQPSTPEEMALLDDEDLDAYFEAFPEQEPYRFPSYVSYSSDGSFKAKRQVVGCGSDTTITTAGPTSTTTSAGTTPTQTVSARQRNEIFTWPGAVAGQTWKYTWKSYQSRTTSTNYQFFHAWQILRRDGCGGAVITLDYVDGQVKITDAVRNCKACAVYKLPINYWLGTTILHELSITYGLSGSIDYKAYTSTNLRVPALTYQATGDMGSSASLKFGQYRRWQEGKQTEALQYIGDFTQTRVA
ncbi:hypothetical protein JCM8547_003060 [Rhodosporidiobolus lusitaniae]